MDHRAMKSSLRRHISPTYRLTAFTRHKRMTTGTIPKETQGHKRNWKGSQHNM